MIGNLRLSLTRNRQTATPSLAAMLLACVMVLPGACTRETAPNPAPASRAAHPRAVFQFHTDGFWLNLHHFLYVLGRAQAQLPDAARRAVADATQDAQQGLERASVQQRTQWQASLDYYARGPALKNAVFDTELVAGVGRLATASELSAAQLDADWAAALDRAAPVYREIWWPNHRAGNVRWVADMVPLLREHSAAVLDFLLKAWGENWPDDGYPVQISAWSNWAGAYSTSGNLLVVSSSDRLLRGSAAGMEMLFHEAMHQWDEAFHQQMVAAAVAEQVRFPRGLDHALVFFTAGEAVRATVPDYQTYAERVGVWQRGSGRFLPAIRSSWAPYLLGPQLGDQAARQAALQALMRSLPAPAG